MRLYWCCVHFDFKVSDLLNTFFNIAWIQAIYCSIYFCTKISKSLNRHCRFLCFHTKSVIRTFVSSNRNRSALFCALSILLIAFSLVKFQPKEQSLKFEYTKLSISIFLTSKVRYDFDLRRAFNCLTADLYKSQI